MKQSAALVTLLSLLFLISIEPAAGNSLRSTHPFNLFGLPRMQAPAQAAQSPQWHSREEYNAFLAIMEQGTNAQQRVNLAEAFIQHFPESDFRSEAYVAEMQGYSGLERTDSAIAAARNALRFDRDNLDALSFLCYVFPFRYHPDDSGSLLALNVAVDDARHGLRALRTLRRPENMPPEQFQIEFGTKRATFNNTIGFVALQRKDYPNAIAALTASGFDNRNNPFTYYWLALAYVFSTPADYDHGIWYLARATGLAQGSSSPSAPQMLRYLRKVFVQSLGSDAAVRDTIAQALASPNPPDVSDLRAAPRGGPPRIGEPANAYHGSSPPLTGAGDQPTSVIVNRVHTTIYPTWLPAPESASDEPEPPPAPEPDETMLGQTYSLPVDAGMAAQEPPPQYTRPSYPPEPAEPEPEPATVLIYKDGHRVEVENYAIVGQNLVWISGQLSKKIPLSDLNLPATRKENEDHGVIFDTPDAP